MFKFLRFGVALDGAAEDRTTELPVSGSHSRGPWPVISQEVEAGTRGWEAVSLPSPHPPRPSPVASAVLSLICRLPWDKRWKEGLDSSTVQSP